MAKIKKVATFEIEDKGQDFITLDILENGVIHGYSMMFADDRLSVLGIGTLDGREYYTFDEVKNGDKCKTYAGLFIYFVDTVREKDPLPWKANTLKYPITGRVSVKK